MKRVVSSAVNKRLISRLMSSRSASSSSKEDENFILKGSSEFASRSNDVFAELKVLEKAHENWISKNNSNDNFKDSEDIEKIHFSRHDIKSSHFPITSDKNCGEEKRGCNLNAEASLFKRPQSTKVYRRRNNIVMKDRNVRKKWTKYSLADVPLTSNATNTAVALAFIGELRKRKIADQKVDDQSEKILFSKPQVKDSHNELHNSKPASKKLFRRENLPTTVSNEKTDWNVKLDHLENEIEETL